MAVFRQHEKRLALSWCGGRAGAGRVLDDGRREAGETCAWVGHLNLICPHRIQVIGATEMRYLSGLGKNSHADALASLYSARPMAVIFADQQSFDDVFLRQAEETATPLFTSALSSATVISHLQHALAASLADQLAVHGVYMEILGIGVLLTGDSGIGKSELALELISRNHRLVADDAAEFRRVAPDVLRGSCPSLLRGYLEVRGLGVLHIRAMFGDSAIKQDKRLRLIIHLQRMSAQELAAVDRLRGSRQERVVLDVAVPQVTLPVAPGHNLAVLAESAVRNHLLLLKGHDAVQHFIDRQAAAITGGN